jgi:thiamine biosynthesis lipoprotein
MRLLLHTARLNAETDRAFDVTIGPLVRAWGFMGGSGQMADASAVAEARSRVGMPHVELNEAARTVRFAKPGMMLDLGAIGKGYAVDCAAELLMEAGVASALIHGGTSAVYAVGRPHEGDSWNVAIEFPEKSAGNPQWVAKVELCDEALSVSAISGKSFHEDGREFGHVIDPRTGEPVNHTHLAAIISPSATEADALSTALLTSGLEGMNRLARNRPGLRMAVVPNDGVPRGIGIRFQEGQRNV